MFTLRCTRKLLDRLRIPPATENDARPDNALGDGYGNAVRVGRDQLVVIMNERSFLTLLLPARGIRDSIASDMPRALRMVLRELEVPEEVVEREIGRMKPMAFARTASRSLVASLNEHARMVDHLWRAGRDPMDIMMSLARLPMTSGPAEADLYPARAARRLLGLDPRPAPAATIVRLHVSLEGLVPPIWRRLAVPLDITLPRLHRALQLAMGWEDRHLHEFDFGGTRYGTPDEDFPDTSSRDETRVSLERLLGPGGIDRFTYTYDFGDDWRHDVRIEQIGPNVEGLRGVVCLDGANHCPPEDVGGPPGYLDLIQALRDPGHERHAEMARWIGARGFDPAAFDVELANDMLDIEFGD